MSKTQTSSKSALKRVHSNSSTWSFSMDHIRAGLAHCDPDKRDLLIWAFTWSKERQIALSEFAAAVDHAPNTLYKIFTGKHVDPRDGARYDISNKLADATRKWKELQIKRADLGEMDFVITPSVNRIWAGCDLARESQSPVFIYGASHLGKTVALEQYALNNNHGRTPMVRVPSASGLVGLTQSIGKKFGFAQKANARDLVNRIIKAIDNTTLLILDEVHQLMFTVNRTSFFRSMEVIRMIYDETKCGMVLCTTNVFGTKLENERRAALEQIFRRGVHKVQLGDKVRVADLKPILAHHRLDWPTKKQTCEIGGIVEKPHDILRQLASDHGLKHITERIRYAKVLARKSEQELNLEHFTKAHLIIENNAQNPQDDWS